MTGRAELSRDGAVAWLRFSNPDEGLMDGTMEAELLAAIDTVEATPAIRVCVLTGVFWATSVVDAGQQWRGAGELLQKGYPQGAVGGAGAVPLRLGDGMRPAHPRGLYPCGRQLKG